MTVTIVFSVTILLDIIIVWYAYALARRMGRGGLFKQVTLLMAFSAMVFGIHHLLELLLSNTPTGASISESVESIAAILLGLAAIQLYRIVQD